MPEGSGLGGSHLEVSIRRTSAEPTTGSPPAAVTAKLPADQAGRVAPASSEQTMSTLMGRGALGIRFPPRWLLTGSTHPTVLGGRGGAARLLRGRGSILGSE